MLYKSIPYIQSVCSSFFLQLLQINDDTFTHLIIKPRRIHDLWTSSFPQGLLLKKTVKLIYLLLLYTHTHAHIYYISYSIRGNLLIHFVQKLHDLPSSTKHKRKHFQIQRLTEEQQDTEVFYWWYSTPSYCITHILYLKCSTFDPTSGKAPSNIQSFWFWLANP